MVAGFRRSLSLPGQNPNSTNTSKTKEKATSYHVRSTSLPCRSHPLVSQIEDELRSLRSWQSDEAASTSSPSWLRAGLSRLDLLHAALDELLQLAQTQDVLRRRRSLPWAERLLDDFLRLADAYGCFREALVSLQQLQSEAQVVVRRKDEGRLTALARAQRKAEKKVMKVASSLRDLAKSQDVGLCDSADAELVGILREVKSVMATVSASVFSGLAAFSASAFAAGCSSSVSSSSSSAWTVLRKKLTPSGSSKRKEEDWEKSLQGLKGLEKCIVGMEAGSERVFRCLINTRVSLLNTLTP